MFGPVLHQGSALEALDPDEIAILGADVEAVGGSLCL